MISRFLTEARDRNVVEVRVNYPLARRYELEQQLQDRLGLRAVRVMERGTLMYSRMVRSLGLMAARLVEELIQDNMIVGIGWGLALWEMINALRPTPRTGVHIVQMFGALGSTEPDTDGPELARRLAHNFNGRYTTLPMPAIVESEELNQSLRKEQRFQQMRGYCLNAGLALLGLGTTDPNRSSMLRASLILESQLEELRQRGAVGDVCALNYNIRGEPVHTSFTRRMLGIDAEALLSMPTKMAIAGDRYKSPAILGACRAGFVDILVTDESAAGGILELLQEGL